MAQGQGTDGREGQAPSAAELARRQEALGRQLEGLEGAIPGAGGEEGEAAREALDRAGRAMDEAARDLERGDLGGAIDDQAQAMDALRDGMQALGRALAEAQGEPGQGQGQGQAQNVGPSSRDPLGREAGNGARIGTDESMLAGPDAAARARELLDELRRRSGEQDRPDLELDYLRRLLERF
jgi:hypothetical protein